MISKNSPQKSMIGKNNIRILNTNLHNNHQLVLDKMRNITSLKNYSLVVCNLAIHYITNSDPHMYNFMSLVDALVESEISLYILLIIIQLYMRSF